MLEKGARKIAQCTKLQRVEQLLLVREMLLEKELVYPFNIYLIPTYFAFSPHILELFRCLSSVVLVTSHCRVQ